MPKYTFNHSEIEDCSFCPMGEYRINDMGEGYFECYLNDETYPLSKLIIEGKRPEDCKLEEVD